MKIEIIHFLEQFHILIGIRKHKDIGTAVVCAVVDFHGELAAAVASVEAIVSGLLQIDLYYSKYSVSWFLYKIILVVVPRGTETGLMQEKFLTPEWIEQFKCNIRDAPVLMVDANLNALALEVSCQSTTLFLNASFFYSSVLVFVV